jgi:hypothetical protein
MREQIYTILFIFILCGLADLSAIAYADGGQAMRDTPTPPPIEWGPTVDPCPPPFPTSTPESYPGRGEAVQIVHNLYIPMVRR